MNAPATASGSPVATYASISSSDRSANRTVVDDVAPSIAGTPRSSISQCPVCSTPDRPRIARHRVVASAASTGLP